MIANFFNKTKPVIIVNLLILFAVFYFASIFLTQTIEISLMFMSIKIGLFIGYILMLLIINFILRKNSLTNDNSYTLFILIMFLISFNEGLFSEELFLSNLFLLFGFRRIYSLNSGINTNAKLFDAAFWIGVASLIYGWSILFLILLYLAMFILTKMNAKKMFIPIVGFAAPVFVYFTYHFYLDQMDVFYKIYEFKYNLIFWDYSKLELMIPLILLIILTLCSAFYLTPKIVLMSNQFKLAWQVLMFHLLISITVVGLSPIKNGSEIWFVLLPASIIITNFLQKIPSEKIKNVILYLLLIISIGVYSLQFYTIS